MLIDHVNGDTLDSAATLQRFDALLIDDGKVIATGSSTDFATGEHKAAPKDAIVIKGKGHTMWPGVSHEYGHVLGLGLEEV